MKTHRLIHSFYLLPAALLFAGVVSAADVKIEQAPDKSVTVEAKNYSARFDADGRWKSLDIAGQEMFGDGAAFPSGGPPSSINVRGQLLAMRGDGVIVEYSFDPNGISIETSGGTLTPFLGGSITAYVRDKGGVQSAQARSLGDVRKVIAGQAAFELDQPFHVVNKKMFPSLMARGGDGKAPFKVRMECGVSADGAEMVEVTDILPIGKQTKTAPFYEPGEKPSYEISLRNLGRVEISPEVTYTLGDAFMGGKTSAEIVLPAVPIKPGETVKVPVQVDVATPGIHWVNFELREKGKVLKRERRAFVYDASNFRPALTRPADFADFWKGRLSTMRVIPLEPKLEEVPARSTETAAQYRVRINGPKGEPVEFDLQVPKKPGKYLAVFGGKMPEKAGNPNQILLVLPHKQWPEEATYNRWVSAEDNNHLDCYLLAVRLTDYLRSRGDVGSIFLKGASRQGPIQLANAALDPTKVAAVDAHVATSMGLSWTELPYRGWGKTPSPPSMANYVDPVNFAPDLTVPVIHDEGVYDGLSPAPGAIAFYNAATKSPWKRLSIELGGHGYFTSGFRKLTTAELEKFLGFPLEASMDDKVMKEH